MRNVKNVSTLPDRHLNLMTVLVFVLVTLALLFLNAKNIRMVNVEIGDFAANSLLIQDAKSFSLWVGNYSRVGFNHPGPAILYVLAAGEVVFNQILHLARSPFGGQLAGVAVYNAFWIALLFRLMYRELGRVVFAILCLTVFIAMTIHLDYQILSGIWFPHLYYSPFPVVLFGLTRLGRGLTDSLVSLALASGFLINGHISFVPILGLMLICVLAYNYYVTSYQQQTPGNGRPVQRILSKRFLEENRPALTGGIAVLILFLIPLLIMTIKNFPGPLADYAHFGGHHRANTPAETLAFVGVYWAGISPVITGLIAMYVFVGTQSRQNRPVAYSASYNTAPLGIALIAATLAALFYAAFGVDMLDQTYIELFYYAVPAVFIAMLVTLGFIMILSKKTAASVNVICLIVTVLLLVWGARAVYHRDPAYIGQYNQPEVIAIYDALKAKSPSAGSTPASSGRIVLDFSSGKDWGAIWTQMAGAELVAKRAGNDLFCINQNWHILFTKAAKCTPQDMQSPARYFVEGFDPARAQTEGMFSAGALTFVPYAFPELKADTAITVLSSPEAFQRYMLAEGWSVPDSSFVWSERKKAVLNLHVPAHFSGHAEIDLDAYLPGAPNTPQTQKVIFRDAEKELASAEFTVGEHRKKVSVPITDLSGSGKITLTLDIQNPVQPSAAGSSTDTRQLGVGLYSIEIKNQQG